jgi:hypothetical protein
VPIQPPIQWVSGAVSPGVKRPGRETDHSPLSNAKVKKGGAISPFLAHIWEMFSSNPHRDTNCSESSVLPRLGDDRFLPNHFELIFVLSFDPVESSYWERREIARRNKKTWHWGSVHCKYSTYTIQHRTCRHAFFAWSVMRTRDYSYPKSLFHRYWLLYAWACKVYIIEAIQWSTSAIRACERINSGALVHQRTTPTERPPLIGEVSANFSG